MNISVGFFGSSLGATELLLILVVALLLFGAKRLPAVARMLGKSMEELRRAAQQFTHEITDGNDPGNPPPGPDKSSPSVDKSSPSTDQSSQPIQHSPGKERKD